VKAFGVQLLIVKTEQFLRAGRRAKAAALAPVRVDYNFRHKIKPPFHNYINYIILQKQSKVLRVAINKKP
jgi:hypothetical protein